MSEHDGPYLLGTYDWKPWKLSGGDGVIPFGIAAIEGNSISQKQNLYSASCPAADSKAYIVNGPRNVTSGRPFSVYQTGYEIFLAYDTGTPAIGDIYGPKPGQSTATKGGSPGLWECLGISNESLRTMRARWIGRGVRMAWATTTVAVASGDADFTVTDIVPFDGSVWTGDDPLTVGNDPDGYSIPNNTRGKILSLINSSGEVEWHPFDYKC